MLTRKEKYIMEYVYQNCTGKKSMLINPRDVISYASDRYIIFTDELDKIMTNLSYDNYIELYKTDKKGEPYYCVSLKIKGEAFHRELSNNMRSIKNAVIKTAVLAVMSGIIAGLVKIIFFR